LICGAHRRVEARRRARTGIAPKILHQVDCVFTCFPCVKAEPSDYIRHRGVRNADAQIDAV
jgi:hypothetical protein